MKIENNSILNRLDKKALESNGFSDHIIKDEVRTYYFVDKVSQDTEKM